MGLFKIRAILLDLGKYRCLGTQSGNRECSEWIGNFRDAGIHPERRPRRKAQVLGT